MRGGKEKRRVLLLLLEERFGPPSPAVKKRVGAVPEEKLEALLRALLGAQSLQALGLEP
jgi:hypothetical protein